MPKKALLRTLMDSQQVKGSERLLKSAREYFCHIFWSPRLTISSKNFVLVVFEILRLFVNILRPNENFCLSVKVSVLRNQFKCNYFRIKKHFLNFFLHFWYLHKTSNALKKRKALEFICLWNSRLQKAGLLKCLKSPVSEHYWIVNKLKGPKACLSVHGSVFAIFLDHSEKKSAQNILF